MTANNNMLANKYDPRLKAQAELTQTLTCGKSILDEILHELIPTKPPESLSRQSWVITGAQGAGKSHLLTLLYRKIKTNKDLTHHWHPLIFPEELFNVDSLYRLIINILENFFKNAPPIGESWREAFITLKKIRVTGDLKQKTARKQALAKQLLTLLASIQTQMGQRLILILENLQDLLRNQISEDDQKVLRAFLNENSKVFIIIGSALTVFNEIENYRKPFFHFFRIRDLEPLQNQEILDFLQQQADFRGEDSIRQKIQDNRHTIYTYNILTGGNPRLVLFLYELMLDNDTLDTRIILDNIPELTPYFLHKTLKESAQRKLILDAMVSGAPAQTATEIALYSNEDQKSISEQMKRLAADGWIIEVSLTAKDIKPKEVFYTIRDYFYRIWYKVRSGDVDEQDVFCMAELVTLLLDKKEIEAHLKKYQGRNARIYEQAAVLLCNESFMTNINLLVDASKNKEIADIRKSILSCHENQQWALMLEHAERLLTYTSAKALAYCVLGVGYSELKNYSKAIECCEQCVAIEPDKHDAWYNMSTCYYKEKAYEKAYFSFNQFIKYAPDFKLIAFQYFDALIDSANHLFTSTVELHNLVHQKTALSKKLESVGHLLLLGKFNAITDTFDDLLTVIEWPAYESKKLALFLEGYTLAQLKQGKVTQEVRIVIKSWILLKIKLLNGDETKLRKEILEFFVYYIKVTEKEHVSVQILEWMLAVLQEHNLPVSEIITTVVKAIRNPATRNAQKWMADPLFHEIVTLSK